jgi:hypothetical protein
MRLVRTLAILSIVALLGACAAAPRASSATASPAPTASSSAAAVGSEPAASASPEAVTVDELIADPQAYAGREVILTATAVREVAPSAWLVGAEIAADSTVLMLDNDLHPVSIGEGETFEIHATVEHFDDPDAMSNEVGALPDMYDQALATYQGSYVLVASDLTTSGA